MDDEFAINILDSSYNKTLPGHIQRPGSVCLRHLGEKLVKGSLESKAFGRGLQAFGHPFGRVRFADKRIGPAG